LGSTTPGEARRWPPEPRSGWFSSPIDPPARFQVPIWFSSEKILLSNKGEILNFANPNSDTFIKEGNYNLEIVVGSSFSQGRNIDVLIAPEILSQKKTDTTTPDRINP